MGWSSSEDLICILEEGTMASYNIHGYLHYTRPISRVSNNIIVTSQAISSTLYVVVIAEK